MPCCHDLLTRPSTESTIAAIADGGGVDTQRLLFPVGEGRQLDVSFGGPAGAPAVLLFELGTPTGRLPYAPAVAWADSRGLGFLTFARPGYARSTRHAGRTVADTAADAGHVADALGIRRLHVVGWSGGGPVAIGLGAVRPDLVASVATIASPSPLRDDDVESRAPEDPMVSAAVRERLLAAADLLERGEPSGWGHVDDAVLTESLRTFLARDIREGLEPGFWGIHDDLISHYRLEWGFDPETMTVPVSIWHGTQDATVPLIHAEWLAAHVPGARLHAVEGEGHVSVAARLLGSLLDELVSRGQPPCGSRSLDTD